MCIRDRRRAADPRPRAGRAPWSPWVRWPGTGPGGAPYTWHSAGRSASKPKVPASQKCQQAKSASKPKVPASQSASEASVRGGRTAGGAPGCSTIASSRCCGRSSGTSSPPTNRSAPRPWPSATSSACRRRPYATTWRRWRTRATSPSRTPAPPCRCVRSPATRRAGSARPRPWSRPVRWWRRSPGRSPAAPRACDRRASRGTSRRPSATNTCLTGTLACWHFWLAGTFGLLALRPAECQVYGAPPGPVPGQRTQGDHGARLARGRGSAALRRQDRRLQLRGLQRDRVIDRLAVEQQGRRLHDAVLGRLVLHLLHPALVARRTHAVGEGRRGQANFRTPLEQVVGRVAVGVLLGLVGVELGVVRRKRTNVHGAPGGVRGAH